MILLILDDGQIGALQICFLYANAVYSEAVHCRVCQQSSNRMTISFMIPSFTDKFTSLILPAP